MSGLILYECLKGQPPFPATMMTDTVREVMANEPTAVSHFRREYQDAQSHDPVPVCGSGVA
jgi:hypothetical protein